MEAETSLTPQDAFNAMQHLLADAGVHITVARPPTLSGVMQDRRTVVAVLVQALPEGSLVSVEGHGWAHTAACRAAKSLPKTAEEPPTRR